MAKIMSEDKNVLVYFDIEGVEVVLRDSDDFSLEPYGSVNTQLQALLEKGVTVYVCPSCLKAAGKTREDLREGVQTAEKEGFFNFTQGRILTLDY